MAAVIRLATPNDSSEIVAIYRPSVVDAATSFEVTPPDGVEMASRIQVTQERLPWIVCEADRTILGYAYASRHRDRAAYQWSVEVSAYVHPGARRAGVARGLYASLFAILAAQGFRNAYAGITLPNPASVALHQAVGFTHVGVFRSIGYKHGAWHDVAWMERSLAPHVIEPPDPLPLPSLIGSATLDAAIDDGRRFLRVGAG